jgi:4'-phosphopantetheinyl transferase
VHVWRAALDLPSDDLDRLRSVLAPEELRRAEHIVHPQQRSRSISSRGLLRFILSGYLGAEPRSLGFRANSFGKPCLTGQPDGPSLEFNVSHSAGLALYAVARGRAVGVDLERIRADVSCEELALYVLSEAERSAWLALPPDRRVKAFYACWTRKEAYAKATGMGLAIPLPLIAADAGTGEPALTPWPDGVDRTIGSWSLRQLPVGPDFAATLAGERSGWGLSCRSWPWPGLARLMGASRD